MSTIRRVAPLSLALFGARISGAAIAFLTQALIVRAWGPEKLGDYIFALSTANIAAAIMPLGFQTVGGYFAARYRALGSRSCLRAYLHQGYFQIAILAVVSLVVIGAKLVTTPGVSSSMSGLWLPLLLMAVAIAFVHLNGSLLSGLKRPVAALIADTLIRPMLMLAGFLVAIDSTHQSARLDSLLWFASISYVVVAAVQAVITVKAISEIADDAAPQVGQSASWWRYALPWAVIGLATDFLFDIDLVMLARFLPRDELAVFGISVRIGTLLAFGVGAVYTVMMPDILEAGVKRDDAEFHDRIAKANIVAAALAAILAAVMFMSGPFIAVVFGPKFAAAGVPLGFLALGLFARATFGPAPLVLSFYDRPYACIPAAVAGFSLLAASNYVLVPAFGVAGAGMAAAIAMTGWSLMQWATALRLLGIDVSIRSFLKTSMAQRRKLRLEC